MTRQEHDEYIELVKDNLQLKRSRYFEIIAKNGICKASNKLAEKIDKEEMLLQELKSKSLILD